MGTKKDINFVFTLKNLFSNPAYSIEQTFEKLGIGAKGAEKQIEKLEGKIDTLQNKLNDFKSKNKKGLFDDLFHGKSPVDHFFGSNSLEKYEKGVERIKHGISNATIASAAIDAGLTAAIWKGVSYQKAMQKAQAGAGRIEEGDTEELKHQMEVEKAVKKYTIHPYTRQERAEYFATAETSGFSREKAAKAHEEIMNFATAAEIPLDEAAQSIITIASQFKGPLEKQFTSVEDQVGFAGDVLVSAAHSDLAVVPELLEAFKQSAGYFVQEGIPYTQAVALIGNYSNFKKGSEAGTDFKNMLSYLNEIRVGRRGAQYFETAGIPYSGLPKGDIVPIFQYFERVLKRLPEKDRPVALKDWFGEQGGPAFLYLEQSGIENVIKRQEHFQEHGRGQAKIKTQEKMAGAQGDARLIVRDISDFFTDIGNELLNMKAFGEFLASIRGVTGDFINAINSSTESSDKMRGLVTGLKEGAVDAFDTISNIFKDFMSLLGMDTSDKSEEAGKKLGYFISQVVIFGSLIAPIGLALAGLGGIFSMIVLPIAGLIGIFSVLGLWPALLIGGFALLCASFDGFLPAIKKITLFIYNSAKSVFTGFAKIIEFTFESISSVIKDFFDWVGIVCNDFTGSSNNKINTYDPETERVMQSTLTLPFQSESLKIPLSKELDIKEIKETMKKKETGEVKVTFDNLPKSANVETVKKGFPEVIVDINKGGRWATA